jgi:hypothetical protein
VGPTQCAELLGDGRLTAGMVELSLANQANVNADDGAGT